MSEDESRKPLLAEVKKLRRRVASLEAGETKRKRAEEALRQSEEYSSTILNHSPNPILVANPDTSIRYVNPALEKLTGYSMVELVGQKAPYPWWTKETLAKLKRDFKEALTHGVQAFEQFFKKKSGERFWVEITATPVKIGGESKYYLASWVDITERKRAEQRIKDSEQKYISAEKVGNFGHFSRYLDTDRLVWSAGTYYIFGVDPNQWELTRENAYKMVHPQDREKHRRDIEEAVRGAKGLDTEFRIIRPSGEERVIHTIADVTFDGAGKPERLFGTMQDITERKQAEEALRESEEMHHALLELGGRIGEAVVMLQDDGHRVAMHVYASNEWARITGYSNDELLNMSMAELIHPRDLKEATKRYEKRIHGEVL
ncbi:MAG: PAS domain S-box protein, partial [Dehalococcoidia bacterium]|nr:PAS domain S-box protein [Dehalococcoidia bacterium]